MAASKAVEIEIKAKVAEAMKRFKEVSQETSKGFKAMKESAEKTTKEFKETAAASQKTTAAFSGLKTALAGLASGWLAYKAMGIAKTFIDVASSVEDYRVRLSTLLGSQQAAADAMQFFNEIAAKSPATLEEVIEAGTTLTAMGADYKKWIPVLNDLAAVMGLKLPEAASALGRAYAGGAGAADIFRERGILNIIKDFAKLKYSIDDITKVELPEFQKIMFEAFSDPKGRIAGAGEELAKTWTGKISMMRDAWFQFKQNVMESGLFEALKQGLDVILGKIDQMKATGDLKRIATEVGATVLEVIATVIEQGGKIPAMLTSITQAMATIGQFAVAMGRAVVTVFDKIAQAVQFPFKWITGKTWVVDPMVYEEIDKLGLAMSNLRADAEKVGPALAGWVPKTKAAADGLRKMADEARLLQKIHEDVARGGDVFGTGYGEAAKETKDTAKQMTYVLDGVEKVVGATEEGVSTFTQFKDIGDKVEGSFKDQTEEVKKLNEELAKSLKIIQAMKETQQGTASGVKSYTPEGMKFGGYIKKQTGGLIPGFGGGDSIPLLAEPGEFMIRKEAVRSLGIDVLNSFNRTGGLGEQKGYFVLEHRVGGKSFPVKVVKEDVADALIEALRKKDLVQG